MRYHDHKWQSAIDREIKKAIQDGRSTDLPGAGKPLDLREDYNVPSDMRMAYKIMRDNDLVPEWISLGKALEQTEVRFQRALAAAVKAYTTGHDDRRWQKAQQQLQNMVDDYNNQVLSYNLKVPPGVHQRPLIVLQRAIEKVMGME